MPASAGDMVLATPQTNSGLKTFLDGTFGMRNVANTFTALFTNAITAARTYTFQDSNGTFAWLSDLFRLSRPTVRVAVSGGQYTDIQTAIDALTTGGVVEIDEGNYTITTGLKWKVNGTIIRGIAKDKTTISFNGATVLTAISPNTTALRDCGLENIGFIQTNATVQGTAVDISNMAISSIRNVKVTSAGLGLKVSDTVNNTFYNRVDGFESF